MDFCVFDFLISFSCYPSSIGPSLEGLGIESSAFLFVFFHLFSSPFVFPIDWIDKGVFLFFL